MNIIIDKNDNYNIKNICCDIENIAKLNKKTTIELINFDYIEVEEFIDDLLENLIWHLSLSDIEDFVEIKDYNNILIGRIYEFYSNSRPFVKRFS